jgi:hypothetical protein
LNPAFAAWAGIGRRVGVGVGVGVDVPVGVGVGVEVTLCVSSGVNPVGGVPTSKPEAKFAVTLPF